jgi:hypothetical protein
MIRVIVNGVSFYTTKARIKRCEVGSDSALNAAIYQLYSNMFNAKGIGSVVHSYDSRMVKKSYDIQIDL